MVKPLRFTIYSNLFGDATEQMLQECKSFEVKFFARKTNHFRSSNLEGSSLERAQKDSLAVCMMLHSLLAESSTSHMLRKFLI